MSKDWTGEVKGRMHTAGITGQMLAKECGYCDSYLSMVLHGKKGSEQTKDHILKSLATLEERLNAAEREQC